MTGDGRGEEKKVKLVSEHSAIDATDALIQVKARVKKKNSNLLSGMIKATHKTLSLSLHFFFLLTGC
jgi:hypothetical protein